MTDARRSLELIQSLYAAPEPPIKIGTLEAIIRDIGDTTYIAVGGSNEANDWLANIRATPWWSSPLECFCHRGFLVSARRGFEHFTRTEMLDRIVVAGHSKGGAEATLIAAKMIRAGRPVKKLVTFGAPRCGYQGLADHFDDVSIERYVNGADPVPSLPWAGVLLRYRHVGDPIQTVHPTNKGGWSDHGINQYQLALDDVGGQLKNAPS